MLRSITILSLLAVLTVADQHEHRDHPCKDIFNSNPYFKTIPGFVARIRLEDETSHSQTNL